MRDLNWLRIQLLVALGVSVGACDSGADTQAKADVAPVDKLDTQVTDALADITDAAAESWCTPVKNGWGFSPYKVCLTADQIKAAYGGPKLTGCASTVDIGLPSDSTADAATAQPKPKPPYKGPLPPNGCPGVQEVATGFYGSEYQLAKSAVVDDKCCYYFCPTGTICGRPLTIAAAQRTADLTTGSDWLQDTVPAAVTSPLHAAALAAAWRADALDEHASIASFQRFGLELMAFGAPPELVRDALLAAGDEVRHVQQCLTIARRLDGADLGPGPLNLTGLQLANTLAQAVVAAIVEGCVGETVAAAHAAAAGRRASDAEVAAALEQIAGEEARHAALAWRFVQWACEVGGAEVYAAAADEFVAVLACQPAPRPADALLVGLPVEALHDWGRLPVAEAQALHRAVLAEVVAPAAAALLAKHTGGDQPT